GAGAAGARPIPRELRARMLGRAITVPAGPGDARPRRVALVRVATDQADANGAIAFRLMVVLLAGSGRAWTSLGHAEIPLENAPFDYEETLLRIARLEDVDDDGEQELLVVIESQTEVQCGTGYCSVRATAVLDVAEP